MWKSATRTERNAPFLGVWVWDDDLSGVGVVGGL